MGDGLESRCVGRVLGGISRTNNTQCTFCHLALLPTDTKASLTVSDILSSSDPPYRVCGADDALDVEL